MRFCEDHWTSLRAALDERGLTNLIAESGEAATTKLRRALEGEDSIDSYEPLEEAIYAIVANVAATIEACGNDPFYLMTTGPEHSVEGCDGFEDRTWPRCPVCYLNLVHEVSCDGDRTKCNLPRTTGYDWMITRAAEDTLEHWENLRL